MYILICESQNVYKEPANLKLLPFFLCNAVVMHIDVETLCVLYTVIIHFYG